MFKVLTLNSVSEKINNILTYEKYTVSKDEGNPDAIIVRSHVMHDMQFKKNLLCIARAGAGYNTIPVERCADEGIVVFNTPGANANAVKEMLIGTLIMASRNIYESIVWTNALKGNGDSVPSMAEKGKSKFVGSEIQGKTLGILGLGATGALVAEAALALGVNVIGMDPHLNLAAAWKLPNDIKSVSEDELIRTSDFISIHAPLTDETIDKFNEDFISKTKPGVILINFSRAAIGNANDIKNAIQSGHLQKYVVDFPTDELLDVPGVVVTPHLASGTYEAEENCAVMAANQIKDFLENGNIRNSVNLPDCDLGVCRRASRITIIHKNIPNLISQFTNIISGANINISDMINKSNDTFAYTMIDLDYIVDSNIINAISAIPDVIKVRLIK